MIDRDLIEALDDELISLCESKGLTGEEIFIIGAMVDDKETIEKYGAETATRMAIEIIKLCDNNFSMISYAVQRALGIRDFNP